MADARKLFEEVDPGAPRAKAQTGVIDKGAGTGRRFARIWLGIIFVMLVAMILVGGLTRLTDSGLSITEWQPVAGALPPTSQADWQTEFDKYKQIPQYKLENRNMTLPEFKSIFWWEWGHRQLGRSIGLVWAIGFFGMLALGKMPRGWTKRFLLLGVLGGFQGAIGWWMVSSGLTGRMVSVASYRLATHLGIAFVIFGLITWFFLSLGRSESQLLQARRLRERRLFGAGTGLMHLAFLQILLGALVAGIDAGRNYTDWPLMAGGFFPPGMWDLKPFWRNFFENDGTVQFIHRMVGYTVVIFALVLWRWSRASGNRATRGAFTAVAVMVLVQMTLGIATVMHSAPLSLSSIHQLGAIVLWTLILRARFHAGYPTPQSVRG